MVQTFIPAACLHRVLKLLGFDEILEVLLVRARTDPGFCCPAGPNRTPKLSRTRPAGTNQNRTPIFSIKAYNPLGMVYQKKSRSEYPEQGT